MFFFKKAVDFFSFGKIARSVNKGSGFCLRYRNKGSSSGVCAAGGDGKTKLSDTYKKLTIVTKKKKNPFTFFANLLKIDFTAW